MINRIVLLICKLLICIAEIAISLYMVSIVVDTICSQYNLRYHGSGVNYIAFQLLILSSFLYLFARLVVSKYLPIIANLDICLYITVVYILLSNSRFEPAYLFAFCMGCIILLLCAMLYRYIADWIIKQIVILMED